MKKSFPLIISIVIFCTKVSAQTNTFPATGNVGIGTTSPASKLHVFDQGKATGIIMGSSNAGFSFLAIGTSAEKNGYSFIESVKSSGTSYGDLVMNYNGGNVGIGTRVPDAKLAVKGNIHAQEIKVDLAVPGPDYVFEKSYNLLSIEAVKSYIEANKHLPEIPSACDMEENGINLSEMNMLLLKKVEELTLYMIRLQEKNQELETRMKKLENK